MDSIRLNVALQPPEDIVQEAITLSQKFGRCGTPLFALDGKNVFPHITLYSPEYPLHNKDKVIAAAQALARHMPPINALPERFGGKEGYVVVHMKQTPELQQAHERAIEFLNPLREGIIRKEFTAITPAQEENSKKYGYSRTMEFFSAHLTLIKFSSATIAEKIIYETALKMKSFVFNEIAVYGMGPRGTCTKLIAKFPLTAK